VTIEENEDKNTFQHLPRWAS